MLKKIFYCVFMIIFIFSCDVLQKDTKKSKTVTIDSIGWILVNESKDADEEIDDHSVKIWFNIYLEEDDIEATDISSFEITSDVSGFYWNIKDIGDKYDSGKLNVRLYVSSLPDQMPIGDYTFDITLTNGNTDTYVFNVPAPNSITTNGCKYIYNEDYEISNGNIPSGMVQLPMRANIVGGNYSSSDETLTVEFRVNQSIIYNGFILLYNDDDTYIGYTTSFRDFTTGVVNSISNSGVDYYVNDDLNTIKITESDVTFFDSSYTLSDATAFCICLTDGNQYAGIRQSYDSCSYTSNYTID